MDRLALSTTRRPLLTSTLLLSAACSVTIPEGKLACDRDADCPSAWMCIDKLCYSEPPDGTGGMDGGAGGMDGGPGSDAGQGGKDGAPGDTDAGVDAGFDAGIDTTSCDAFTPFYRDSDGDGLGDSDNSIAVCSVETGYVTNADDCDDTCELCTKPDATEVCDGFDNECDGKVDDGALEVSQPIAFEGMEDGDWAEMVATAEGGVLFSVVQGTTAEIRAQRFDVDGKAIGDPVTVAGAVPRSPVLAADHLSGKIVLVYVESDGVKATVLKASDLSSLVAETTVSSTSPETLFIDVALSTSASGGRALIAYDASDRIRVKGLRLTNLALDTSEREVYTLPADNTAFWYAGALVGGPCLSGYYLAVLDMNGTELSVIPLGDDGQVSGTTYSAPSPAPKLFTAQPVLRVEGGDCTHAPTRVVLAYATGDQLITYTDAHLELELLDVERAAGDDTLTKNGGASITHTGWVLPAVRAYPSGAFFANRALDVVGYQDAYVLAAMAASTNADTGSVNVYEIEAGELAGAHEIPTAPVLPLNMQLSLVGGQPFLGAASWSDDGAAAVMRIGCAP